MRLSIATCFSTLLVATPLAYAQPASAPATRKLMSLQPAQTPGEAILRAMQAMADGDDDWRPPGLRPSKWSPTAAAPTALPVLRGRSILPPVAPAPGMMVCAPAAHH
jgi:hypothetical protein